MRNLAVILMAVIPFTLVLAVILSIWGAIIYVGGSTITSGVKALSKNCGQTYGVESVFNGDWFCPIEEEDND